MAQRAGRGAQLLKMLEEKKKAKAEEAKEMEEFTQQGREHPKVILAKGRGALLEQLRRSSEAKAASTSAEIVVKTLTRVETVSVDSGCVENISGLGSVKSR